MAAIVSGDRHWIDLGRVVCETRANFYAVLEIRAMRDYVPYVTVRVVRRIGAVDLIVHRIVCGAEVAATFFLPRASRLIGVTFRFVGCVSALLVDLLRELIKISFLILRNTISAIDVNRPFRAGLGRATAAVIWQL